jgi:hypothetical protein
MSFRRETCLRMVGDSAQFADTRTQAPQCGRSKSGAIHHETFAFRTARSRARIGYCRLGPGFRLHHSERRSDYYECFNGRPKDHHRPGGCGANGCIPLGITGYIVNTSAPELVVTGGVYKFTYLGAGDSVNDNKFAIAGGGTFCSQAFAGCNGGVQTPIGTSFTVTLAAGAIPFVFTAARTRARMAHAVA